MKFLGRAEQRKKLHRILDKDSQAVSLIYGRRRVGKSELIKQVLRESDIAGIYYECKQTTEMNNVESLAVLIAGEFHLPRPAFANMEEVLDFLFQKACGQKMIFVLDEYSYLRDCVTGMDSILQSLIDKYSESSSIKLILCGSFVDIMKSLLYNENPLYGRVDLTINLKPMDYFESSLFYPEFSDEDKVRLYSVFGGIPYFNRLIEPGLTVRENITELIASPGARLENEVSMYLKSEISKIINANEVFDALARGFSKYSDILSQSHVSSGPAMVDVLDKLMRMEMVEKEAPINDENNRKKMSYRIVDNLSLFYYRYIFRYLSQMNVMEPETFYDRYIKEDFETVYVPRIFETVCRQYLIRLNRRGLLEEPFEKIGKYYYDDPVRKRNGEFDIVTKDAKGYIFYEAKFRKEPVTQEMIQAEISQVKETGFECYKYGFMSRSGFTAKQEESLILISLEEMYNKIS
ncbi:MAG: AAA family ATPase [Lachnospiraceae bacterium]|jgi:AAA+ ATPase superfamily predicted ATPase|nr:AAA family ATPase [Lachnospiraceae bacterium]